MILYTQFVINATNWLCTIPMYLVGMILIIVFCLIYELLRSIYEDDRKEKKKEDNWYMNVIAIIGLAIFFMIVALKIFFEVLK